MDILGGGFWVEVRFEDYSSRLSYIHVYIVRILAVGSISDLLGVKWACKTHFNMSVTAPLCL